MGGGTGWVLEKITEIHFQGLSITYIDASPKMIGFAQMRNTGNNKITFITSQIEDVQLDKVYDVIFTPFLFDNFTNSQLQKIFSAIDKSVKQGALWLYCDFQTTGVFWQKALLKIMYVFFRITCGIEAKELPNAGACFKQFGYQLKEQETFMSRFIVSNVYCKQ